MPLFGPKRKKVVVAEESTERTVYDYRDMDVPVSGYEREREGQPEYVPPYTQRRRTRDPEHKPHWYSLRRKKDGPSFLERGGDAAESQADLLEK